MQTKTRKRKQATSGATATDSKTTRSPLRGNGRESKVLKSEQVSLDEQYRELFDVTSDLIQSVAPDGRILYTNKAWRDVLGYGEEEIAHLKIWDVISPESMDHCMELFKRVMAGEHVRDIEAVFVAKDGRQINVEGNSKCRFVKGKPVSTQGFFRDVTSRKQAEEVLAASEARYRSLVDTAGVGVASVDLEGNFVFVNDTACEMMGYSQKELIGKAFADFVHPDDVKRMMDLFLEATTHPELRPDLEFRVVRKDGRILWLYSCPTPIFYGDTFSGASAIIIDITERKQAEEALRQSEERYRTLFNSKLDGMFVMDETMKVLLANQAAADIFGFDSIDEAPSVNPFDFIPPEERDRVLDIVKEDMFGHDLRQVQEFHLTNKSGKDIWISAIGMLIEYQGKLAGLVSFRDITQQKQAEEELRKSEERYRTVLEQMEEAYYEVDIAGNFTFVNDATCRQLGYSREELTGMNYRVYTSKDDVKRVYEIFNKVYRTGKPKIGFPVTRVRKDGARIFTENSAFPLRDENGKIAGFRGVVRDVTASKKSAEEYQTIIRTAMDGFWLSDMEGHFLDVNEAYCHLVGYSRDELLNMSISDIEAIDKPKDVAKRIRKVKRVGHDRFESRHRRKDGELVDVEVSINYLSTDGGRHFVFIRDITERKRAEQALADEATRRRILIDQSSDGIVVLDEKGKVYEVNQRFAEMLGYSLEEARELHVWDWEFQFPREQVREMIRTVDEKGDHFETRHRRKDGTTYDVEISTNGAVIAGYKLIFCVCRDITARKQAEESLRKSEELFRLIAENTQHAVWFMDLDLRTTYASPSVTRTRGYTFEELKELPLEKQLTPESLKVALDALAEESAPEKLAQKDLTISRQLELEFYRKDGSTLWADAAFTLIRDDQGNPMKILGTGHDITERKRAEEALANEASRRRILFDHSRDGIVVLDENAKVVEANQRFAEMLGYTPEEVRELHTWDWDTQWTRDELLEKGRGVDEAGVYLETKHRRKDGTIFDVGISINGVMFGGQKLIFCVCRDITERKQAEAEISHLASFPELNPDPVLELDEVGNVTYINAAAKKVFPDLSILGSRHSFLADWEAVAHKLKGQKRRVATRDISVGDSWYEQTIVYIPSEKSYRIYGLNISERKKAEEAIRRSEQNFRDSIESSPLGIRVFNKDGKTLYVNQALLDMWGYNSIEELEAVPRKKRYPPQSYVEHMARVKKGRRGDMPSNYEVSIIRDDGQVRHLSGSTRALLWNGERQFQAVYQDITARKQAEEALRESEERYRFLVELSPEAIFVSTEGKHVFINSAAMKLLVASSPEQIIGKRATDFIHPDYREIAAERMRKAVETGIAPPVIEEKFIRLDGKVIDVEVRAAPLVYQGKTAMQAVVSDITERKQAEENVKKLYTLQTAIRYINESLLKVDDEQALFEQVCRFLTDVEFIKFCWIGLADKESLEVKPVAYSGFEDGYLSSLKIHLVKNRGPVGVAIKTHQPCTVDDIENDSRFKPRREAALKRGYASSLAVPLIHEAEVIGVLSVYSGSKGAFGDAEINFLVEAASDIALGISTLRLRRELQQSFSSLGKTLQGTVSALASVAEVRDPYTAGHQQRVTRLAVAIATEMALPQEQIEGIHVAGTLHDVGKLYVPAEILSKPGKLSEAEFNLVKLHSQAGYDILKSVEFPWPVAKIVLQHHERLDGSGYPQGLKDKDILLEAKILAVADVVEAMASHRPYRPSLGMGQALDEISKNSGILYDPEVVDACFKLFYEKEFKLD